MTGETESGRLEKTVARRNRELQGDARHELEQIRIVRGHTGGVEETGDGANSGGSGGGICASIVLPMFVSRNKIVHGGSSIPEHLVRQQRVPASSRQDLVRERCRWASWLWIGHR